MTERNFTVFRFKGFEVREREFLLLRGEEALSVEPKAFRVLVYLLRHPRRLITKDEILNAIWGETSVSDNSLTRSIATLRKLLEDDSREPQFIATVPTVGYRFLCEVESFEETYGAAEGQELGAVNPNAGIGSESPQASFGGRESRSDRWKTWKSGAWLVVVSLLFIVGYFIWNRSKSPEHVGRTSPGSSSAGMRISPLTSLPGSAWAPAFSPDGSQVAYVWDGENPVRGDLYVQQIGGTQSLRLTHSLSGFICCADWSPDGHQIAFIRCGDKGDEVLVISPLGGPERKLTTDECPYWIAGPPTWTSDGKSLVLRDRCAPGSPPGLVLFTLSTGDKTCLHNPPAGALGDSDRDVSPDQKTVAFIGSASTFENEIYTVPIKGGPAKRLTYDAKNITELMWSPDGRFIIFNSNRGGLERVWRVPAEGGTVEPEPVFPGVGALSRDGRRLAYVQPAFFFRTASEIWRAELEGSGGPVKSLTRVLDSTGGNDSPQPSPDRLKIAFSSFRTGTGEIWRSDWNGKQPIQLTKFGGHAGTPRWSPDGKWICFDYGANMHTQIYLIDSEGRNAHPLTSGESENLVPSWSRDGSSVYFASNRTGDYEVWKVKLATGNQEQITHHGGFAALESSDSKALYFSKFIGNGIWTVPVEGGTEQPLTDAPHVGYWGHFAVTDEGLYLLDADASPGPSIMFYDFHSRSLKNVLRLEKDPLPWQANLGASSDGRVVYFAQGTHTSSISLAEYPQ